MFDHKMYKTFSIPVAIYNRKKLWKADELCLAKLFRKFHKRQMLTNFLRKKRIQIFSNWLSEDAMRVIDRIQYDPKTNQMIGFVLPLGSNGMLKTNSFLAWSAKVIEELFIQKNELHHCTQ